jgi:hypothetical protein
LPTDHLGDLAVGAGDALGHEATGPDLIAGDQLVEAHDLATPAIAVVAGGLVPALRPFSRTLQSPIPCGGNVNLFES